ncbi:tetratricopeptide repeat protein [bacterium]|nr:tetratricopeptide repeat protein [bacterium]
MRKTLLLLLLSAGLSAQPELASLNVVPSRASGPPVHLTSSDGVGLRLTQYQAKVAVQGPLAFTELHLKFHNPQDRVLEGRFEITLPEGAALSRLAMKNDKGWQEAEVVELQQARRAYEDFLHRRQDPALLEKQAGNQFQARIFPIPSAGDKEIIISYSQESLGDYRLPVSGLPKVDELSVQATVWNGQGNEKLSYTLHSEPPKGDFIIHRPPGSGGLVNGQDVLLVVKPQLQTQVQRGKERVLVLVDTSASRAAGYQRQVQNLRALIDGWGEAQVQLAAFDQEVVPLDLAQLARRRPLGATDLAGALDWANQQKGFDRLLLVSDGVNTLDPRTLKLSNFKRLDLLMVGGIRDSQSLQPLAYHGLPESGYMLDGEMPISQLLGKLKSKPASGLKVSVQGADWVWPNRLDGVAPGEERVVYAHLNQPAQSVRVSVDQQTYQQALSSVPQPLLHRSSVAANLNRLSQQYRKATGSQKEQIGRHMVELSTGNRVVCDLTGLLVLESEDDYKRFKIDRRALSDIMVAGEQGVQIEKRTDILLSQAAPGPVVLQSNKPMDADKAKVPAPEAKQLEQSGAIQRLAAGAPNPTNREVLPTTQNTSEVSLYHSADDGRATTGLRRRAPSPREGAAITEPAPRDEEEQAKDEGVAALTGQFAQIDRLLRRGDTGMALRLASQWHAKSPGDVLALVALGRSLQASGQLKEAARAYASIVDLYPGRADLRRYAGALLESLKDSRLAIDTYRQAVEQRPDHPSGARMLAYSLVKANRLDEAFQVLEKALQRKYPDGRFADVQEILQDDLGMVAAAIIARDPAQGPPMIKKLHLLGVPLAKKPSLRFVLTWETDANDVDFHIKDSRGGHAFYSQPNLASGGRLYADVTTGYGPECFNIPGGGEAFPYHISIHYYSRGPMGYGMGKVEVLRHDGKGRFRFDERPFVVMNDQAYVDLGPVQP